MKKLTVFILTVAAVLLLLTACGQSAENESDATGGIDISQLKTLGDVFGYKDNGDFQEAYSTTSYVLVFNVEGVCYRVTAELPKDVSDAVWALDDSEDKDQKAAELLAPVEISKVENLSENIPEQSELDKYVGKTGQELFDEGWSYWYYNLDEMEAGLNYGDYNYKVRFDYDGEPMENTDDFDFYEAFKDLTVSSVTFEGIGDAANPE